MRRKVVWFTLVIAACVLVVLVANELFLQPGQGGLFNRGNQSVPLIPALEFSRGRRTADLAAGRRITPDLGRLPKTESQVCTLLADVLGFQLSELQFLHGRQQC
jgi:hypothetical protein